jgi:hypothetical protein
MGRRKEEDGAREGELLGRKIGKRKFSLRKMRINELKFKSFLRRDLGVASRYPDPPNRFSTGAFNIRKSSIRNGHRDHNRSLVLCTSLEKKSFSRDGPTGVPCSAGLL